MALCTSDVLDLLRPRMSIRLCVAPCASVSVFVFDFVLMTDTDLWELWEDRVCFMGPSFPSRSVAMFLVKDPSRCMAEFMNQGTTESIRG